MVLPLAYVILTGDTSLSLPSLLTQANPVSKHQSTVDPRDYVPMSQCQRRENTVPQFAPPVVRLDQDTSLRQPVYVPAQTTRPRAHRLGWRERNMAWRRGEDGEGSSTVSQADLQAVVDAQYPEYVVIEASPRETGVEVGAPSPSVSPLPAEQSRSASYHTHTPRHNLPISSTMFLDALMSSLSARTDDQRCLFTLCLLYALVQNNGVCTDICLPSVGRVMSFCTLWLILLQECIMHCWRHSLFDLAQPLCVSLIFYQRFYCCMMNAVTEAVQVCHQRHTILMCM